MTEPTAENIDACLDARKKAIFEAAMKQARARAHHYANRSNHRARTAQEAVAWAIADFGDNMTYETPER